MSLDILDCVIPVYKVSKLVGLAPFTIFKKNGVNNITIYRKDVMYSVCMITLFAILAYAKPSMESELIGQSRREFDVIIYEIRMYFPILTVILSGITILYRRAIFIQYFKSMLQIDKKISKCNIVIKFAEQRKMVYINYGLCIVLTCILTIIGKIYQYLTNDTKGLAEYLLDSVFQIHYFVHITLMLQVWLAFNNICYRFQLINTALKDTNEENSATIKLIDVKPLQIGIAENQHEKSFICDRDNILKKIHNLCSIHNDLRSATKLINKIFSLVLLLIVTGMFVNTISRLYFVLHDYEQILKRAGTITAVVLENILHFCIVRAANCVTEESSLTGLLVHRIYNKNNSAEWAKKLKVYSLQLYHQKVVITACGMFQFDYSIILSVSGAITTYLVILYQFNEANLEKEGNTTLKN